jgi:hypothetical protein
MEHNTQFKVTVSYFMEYDGKVTEDDIDINDIITDLDAITDIKVKTKTYEVSGSPLFWNRASAVRS